MGEPLPNQSETPEVHMSRERLRKAGRRLVRSAVLIGLGALAFVAGRAIDSGPTNPTTQAAVYEHNQAHEAGTLLDLAGGALAISGVVVLIGAADRYETAAQELGETGREPTTTTLSAENQVV